MPQKDISAYCNSVQDLQNGVGMPLGVVHLIESTKVHVRCVICVIHLTAPALQVAAATAACVREYSP